MRSGIAIISVSFLLFAFWAVELSYRRGYLTGTSDERSFSAFMNQCNSEFPRQGERTATPIANRRRE